MYDRFDYAANLTLAGSYRGTSSASWPPAHPELVASLDLEAERPHAGDDLAPGLTALREAIDAESRSFAADGAASRTRFVDPGPMAAALRRVAACLPSGVDRRAVLLRAGAVENGWDDDVLKALADVDEDVTVVAGRLSTWFGKQVAGLPTAFACRRDAERQCAVDDAYRTMEHVAAHITALHADLRLGDVPAFAATRLFFMAGEGDLHPKHIAYFLPEDEGVRHSPFKKTYYFANTHQALLTHQSAVLAARFLDVGTTFDPAAREFAVVPTLGVLGHELGHCVHRPGATFRELNAADRWTSVVLQEVAADVFGILVTAEVWSEHLGVATADVVAYHLAECLRYLNRGLGHFPDSDGMFLQLGYLTQLGALAVEGHDGRPVLGGDPATVVAGLRSLARVLADTLLAGRAAPALALFEAFGPPSAGALAPLVDAMRALPTGSIHYSQQHREDR